MTYCNVITTTIQDIVKKLRLLYDVDAKLLCSCYGEAIKRNYGYIHWRNYESYCYIAAYRYAHAELCNLW